MDFTVAIEEGGYDSMRTRASNTIAGRSSPSTLASIAALHNKLAVSTALSLIALLVYFYIAILQSRAVTSHGNIVWRLTVRFNKRYIIK